MKKLGYIALAFLLFAFFAGAVSAVEITCFDELFQRQIGQPRTESHNFNALATQATVKVYNGDGDHWLKRAKAANVKINGDIVFKANDFKKREAYLETHVDLLDGENSIDVTLLGMPGVKFRVEVVQEVEEGDSETIYIPGIDQPVITQTIGIGGGTLEAPEIGTPIDGIKVYFPPSALGTDTTVILGYDNGTVTPNSGVHSGKTISLNIEGKTNFEQPIEITVPFEGDNTIVPIPYYVEPSGRLRPTQLLRIDRDNNTFTFRTFHASFFTWFFGINVAYAPDIDDIVDTEYHPQNDGFQIKNKGNEYNRDGECWGMTAFSLWYFLNHKATMGEFYQKYYNVIGQDYKGDSLVGQDLIATRAYISIGQQFENYRSTGAEQLALSESERFTVIMDNIITTRNPVILYLFHVNGDVGAHSVLAYAFNALSGNISIYDPNYPATVRTINYNSAENSFDDYDGYDGIIFFGDGGINWTEPYQNILDDAEANFQGTNRATIRVTSHTHGQEVSSTNVNLVGTIESAELLVNKVRVFVGSFSFSADVDLDGNFNIPINLQSGINHLEFLTLGNDVYGNQTLTISNCVISSSNEEILDFTLNANGDDDEPIVTGKIPDTGQTTSYTDTFGEDSDYNINPQSYTKLDENGNDLPDSASEWVMVRDNVTGLIWENKTDDSGIHDKDNIYTWQNAQDLFITQLNTQNFGGHNDWRLPTVMELSLLVNAGRYNPAINQSYFQNTRSSSYWSSTSVAYYPSYAWDVYFYDGFAQWVSGRDKSSSYYVRAVRGGQTTNNLIDNGDGTVTDTQTGLMWQKNEAGRMNWETALAYCESLTLSVYDDWRLPNRNELQSLVAYERYGPSIDTTAFPGAFSSYYWSSTSFAYVPGNACYVDFGYSFVYTARKSNGYYVRAVRGVGGQYLEE